MLHSSYPEQSLPELDFIKIKQTSIQAAIESGHIFKQYYAKKLLNQSEAAHHLITKTCHVIEQKIVEIIEREYPQHRILGQEAGEKINHSDYVWIINPLNGIQSFIHGGLDFGIVIALLKNNVPIFGLIYHPILNELIIGDGKITLFNSQVTSINSCPHLIDATLLTTDFRLIKAHQNWDNFNRLMKAVNLTKTWGHCYGYTLLARGLSDIMIDPITKPWDAMALIPIILGAGGTITDYHGNNPLSGRGIVACSKNIQKHVIQIINAGYKEAQQGKQEKPLKPLGETLHGHIQINCKLFSSLSIVEQQQLISKIVNPYSTLSSMKNHILEFTGKVGGLIDAVKSATNDLSIDLNPTSKIINVFGECLFSLLSTFPAQPIDLKEKIKNFCVPLSVDDEKETLTTSFYNYIKEQAISQSLTLNLVQEYISKLLNGNLRLSILMNQIKDEMIIHTGKLAEIASHPSDQNQTEIINKIKSLNHVICDCVITICFFANLYRINLANALYTAVDQRISQIIKVQEITCTEYNQA